jgi:hypothetical protein
MHILKYISALSGHRQVINLYIQLFTLLILFPALANILHIRRLYNITVELAYID